MSPDPDTAAHGLSFHVDLPLSEHAAALARRTVADVLCSWHVADEEWTYDVMLVCSELVGNAVRHGGRRVALRLSVHEAVLTVEVSDGSAVLPVQRSEPLEESGRGMGIVVALASGWGVRRHGTGKTVWVATHLPPPHRTGSGDAERAAVRSQAS